MTEAEREALREKIGEMSEEEKIRYMVDNSEDEYVCMIIDIKYGSEIAAIMDELKANGSDDPRGDCMYQKGLDFVEKYESDIKVHRITRSFSPWVQISAKKDVVEKILDDKDAEKVFFGHTVESDIFADPFEHLTGDINRDGVVDFKDASLLIKYLSGWETEYDVFAAVADANGDGSVDYKDVANMLKKFAGR